MARQIDVSTLGGRIKHKRILAGMTQENLAELMFVKHTLISQYESNATLPPLDKLQEMAKLLETSVCYLVDGIELSISAEDMEMLSAFNSIKNEVLRKALIEHAKQLASA